MSLVHHNFFSSLDYDYSLIPQLLHIFLSSLSILISVLIQVFKLADLLSSTFASFFIHNVNFDYFAATKPHEKWSSPQGLRKKNICSVMAWSFNGFLFGEWLEISSPLTVDAKNICSHSFPRLWFSLIFGEVHQIVYVIVNNDSTFKCKFCWSEILLLFWVLQ